MQQVQQVDENRNIYFIPFPSSLSRQDSEDHLGEPRHSLEAHMPPQYNSVYLEPPPAYNEVTESIRPHSHSCDESVLKVQCVTFFFKDAQYLKSCV